MSMLVSLHQETLLEIFQLLSPFDVLHIESTCRHLQCSVDLCGSSLRKFTCPRAILFRNFGLELEVMNKAVKHNLSFDESKRRRGKGAIRLCVDDVSDRLLRKLFHRFEVHAFFIRGADRENLRVVRKIVEEFPSPSNITLIELFNEGQLTEEELYLLVSSMRIPPSVLTIEMPTRVGLGLLQLPILRNVYLEARSVAILPPAKSAIGDEDLAFLPPMELAIHTPAYRLTIDGILRFTAEIKQGFHAVPERLGLCVDYPDLMPDDVDLLEDIKRDVRLQPAELAEAPYHVALLRLGKIILEHVADKGRQVNDDDVEYINISVLGISICPAFNIKLQALHVGALLVFSRRPMSKIPNEVKWD